MRLTDELWEQARAAAEGLLNAVVPMMRKAPPVDLGVVCRYLGIEVYACPCGALGALYVEGGKRKVLMVNSAMNQGRARFSVAHELGHVLLGHRASPSVSAAQTEWQERQADRFAAELLMPARLLAAEEARGVEALCRAYGVSRQAMRLRLETLAQAAPPSPATPS